MFWTAMEILHIAKSQRFGRRGYRPSFQNARRRPSDTRKTWARPSDDRPGPGAIRVYGNQRDNEHIARGGELPNWKGRREKRCPF